MTVGQLLRLARQARSIPQLELARILDVSQRHISFVESGRARPSRSLILEWAQAVDASPDLAHAALMRAGFAPRVDAGPAAPAAWSPLQLLMSNDSPAPLILFDLQWKMVGMNAAGEWLAAEVMSRYWHKVEGMASGMDMIDAMADDDGLFLDMCNPHDAGASLLAQIEQESWVRPALGEPLEALRRSLSRRFDIRPGNATGRESPGPRHLQFNSRFGTLSFHAVLTMQSQPSGLAAGSLRLEHWVPADARTRAVMVSECLGPGGAPQPLQAQA